MSLHIYTDLTGNPVIEANVPPDGSRSTFKNLTTGKASLPGTGRPLYALPRLVQAEYIILVSNEMVADAINGADLLSEMAIGATCISGGANAFERTDLTPIIDGPSVTMWFNNDPAGKKLCKEFANFFDKAGKGDALYLIEPTLDDGPGYGPLDVISDPQAFVERLASMVALVEQHDQDGQSTRGSGDNERFAPRPFAQGIIDQFGGHIFTIGDAGKATFAWNTETRIYEKLPDIVLGEMANKLIGNDVRTHQTVDVVNMVRYMTYRPDNPFLHQDQGAAKFVACKDVDLIVTADGIEMVEPSPERYVRNRLNAAYQRPNFPKSSLWTEVMMSHHSGTVTDTTERLQYLQEFAGTCLCPTPEWPQCLIAQGGGSNGKSIFMKGITSLLGAENYSAVSMDNFKDRFSSSRIDGKLLNIDADMRHGTVLDDKMIKLVTTSDPVDVEQKFQPAYTTRLYAKMIGLTNSMPILKDYSEGHLRRLTIVTYLRKFEDHEKDHYLEHKLSLPDELTGILHWALAGLVRMLKTRSYTRPPSSDAAMQEWLHEMDSVRQFVSAQCKPNKDRSESASVLYRKYVDWCQAGQIRSYVGSKEFNARLVQAGYRKYLSNGVTRIGGLHHRTHLRDVA